MTAARLERARLALEGLSVGDAFGQRFFGDPELVPTQIAARALPPAPWSTTDDTEMGLAVYEVLARHGFVNTDALASRFAERYLADPARGYGGTAHGILQRIAAGEPWPSVARSVFDGGGSMGNGAAMRVAPAAGFFADDLDAALRAAEASAAPTHAHREGVAGAVAVAAACVYAWRATRDEGFRRAHPSLLRFALDHTPDGETRAGIAQAAALDPEASVTLAASVLGTGARVIASDTVPFSLWCAARHTDRFDDALWTTVEGLGDRDTTCAIVGGIVALAARAVIPAAWREAREPLGFTLSPIAMTLAR
ncbi:MAG: ADP-ribosylglycohydrolase family protein [Polyangiales bacterium]